ncbi:hypothetical protein FRC03_009730 [Tulasnella sp. 419]|nr:hypothetical protein FRC03_009730 [Tulasnella sp. 419]
MHENIDSRRSLQSGPAHASFDSHQPSSVAQALTLSRKGIALASVMSDIGFFAAKGCTQLGFSVARHLATSAITSSSTFTERAIFGYTLGADKALNCGVSKFFDVAQAITIVPISLTQRMTEFSIQAASSSVDTVSNLLGYPGGGNDGHLRLTFDRADPDTSDTSQGYISPFSSDMESFMQAIPSLVRVLHDEWQNPQGAEQLPAESYSALSIGRALVAWAAIQNATRSYHEGKWLRSMHEITEVEWKGWPRGGQVHSEGVEPHCGSIPCSAPKTRSRPSSTYVIQSDIQLPDHGGELLTAEIGIPHRSSVEQFPSVTKGRRHLRLRQSLRRFSRMVLGGYGGAGIVFFGVSLPSSSSQARQNGNLHGALKGNNLSLKVDGHSFDSQGVLSSTDSSPTTSGSPNSWSIASFLHNESHQGGVNSSKSEDRDVANEINEERALRDVLEDDQYNDDGDDEWESVEPLPPGNPDSQQISNYSEEPTYSWWSLLLGRHDQEIFEAFANHNPESASQSPIISVSHLPGTTGSQSNPYVEQSGPRAVVFAGVAEKVPRFWVLTDHQRQQVVLVLRGTMSLNEIAVDLACKATAFEVHQPSSAEHSSHSSSTSGDPPYSDLASQHSVHEGMLALAKTMGTRGKPVHDAVANALEQNEGYDLVLCGHSLGAGICSILALMWADPSTCLTVLSSGLPTDRTVIVYAFAPPCVMSPDLSRASSKMVTSFVYSHDVVGRLSLGTMRDLQRVTRWLCYGQDRGHRTKESCSNIISRAIMLERDITIKGVNLERSQERDWVRNVMIYHFGTCPLSLHFGTSSCLCARHYRQI